MLGDPGREANLFHRRFSGPSLMPIQSEVHDFSPEAIEKKRRELLDAERRYERTKNPLIVLQGVLDAHLYGLSLPDWLLRAQAKINQAILHAGHCHHGRADFAGAIVRAIGLSKKGRGTVFSEEEHDSYLLFLGYLIEQFRSDVKSGKIKLPNLPRQLLSLTTTYAYLDGKLGWGVSERTLRRAWKRLREARAKRS